MRTRSWTNKIQVAIVIALVVAGFLLFFPSEKQRRETRLKKELATITPLASVEDIARVKKASSFNIAARGPKKADLYLFVPALNNNIAVISGPKTNPFLGNDFKECEVHVMPVIENGSPTSNLALKLALAFPGAEGQGYIDLVGQHPTTARPQIEETWATLPKLKQSEVESKVSTNVDLLNESGDFQAFLVYGDFQLKGRNWSDFRAAISQLRDYYARH